MAFLDQITPVVLTWNEEANIARCLEKLSWAKRVVVVDSFSSDKTTQLVGSFSNAELLQRKFDLHSNQWNYGLDQVTTEWVLSLDADYILSDELIDEMNNLNSSIDGYWLPFQYCISGKPLRATLLPPRLALFRKAKASYFQDGHTQLLKIEGAVVCLKSPIRHDDQKPFSRWWLAQKKYVVLEATKLRSSDYSQLSLQDKLRKIIFIAPLAVFIYCLFGRGLILDGRTGLIYSTQRFLAEFLLSVNLFNGIFTRRGVNEKNL